MFCGPSTVDVSLGFASGNIDSRGSTKHTAFPKSQSISVNYQSKLNRGRKGNDGFSALTKTFVHLKCNIGKDLKIVRPYVPNYIKSA